MDHIDKLAVLLELIIDNEEQLLEAYPTAIAQEIEVSTDEGEVETRKRKLSLRCRIDAAKKARDRGEAYKTPGGKSMPPREQRPPCGDNCRLKCTKRIREEERADLFRDFWSIANHTAQWDFIARNMSVSLKGKCTTERGESRRSNTRTYYFHLRGKPEQVCKTMFLNTLGISNAWVATVCKKLAINGHVSTDGRGKIGHRRKKIVELV